MNMEVHMSVIIRWLMKNIYLFVLLLTLLISKKCTVDLQKFEQCFNVFIEKKLGTFIPNQCHFF